MEIKITEYVNKIDTMQSTQNNLYFVIHLYYS